MISDCSFSLKKLHDTYNGCFSKDRIFNDLYNSIYGFCDKDKVHRHILNLNGYTGFCTTKWLEETVVLKCYDCEYDTTCAICLECFFNSNHDGHEFQLSRTSGGCCDCGDFVSWDTKGSCYKHIGYLTFEDEKNSLNCFTKPFLSRLNHFLTQIVEYVLDYLRLLYPYDDLFVQILLSFLNDFTKITPAYRYTMCLVLDDSILINWMLKHSVLSVELQKSFNSLYLTLLTSMSFKRRFSTLFASLYSDIVLPLNELTDEWHLSNLSVQLFTYPNIALELINSSFIDVCLGSVLNANLGNNHVTTLRFDQFDRGRFSLYISIISDLTYLLNHQSSCKLLLTNEKLQRTILTFFLLHNNMNTVEREDREHVCYENTAYSIAFTIEHTMHVSLKPFADYCKGIAQDERADLLKFYNFLNDFILQNLDGMRACGSNKLARSFHIPLIRFFGYTVDINHVRNAAKSFIRSLSRDNERVAAFIETNFPNLDGCADTDILNVFDVDVLKFIIHSVIDVIKFSMEVKSNLWVYNGESMYDQRSNYYELEFHSFDIAALQVAIILLGMKRLGGHNVDILSLILQEVFEPEFNPGTYNINDIAYINELVFSEIDGANKHASALEDVKKIKCFLTPGDIQFKNNLFYYLLNTILMDIRHIEILSIPRKVMKDDFIRRGYPLIKADIANTLIKGNVEFGQIVNEIKGHWKHHPKLIEIIENVAFINYSKVSDKTYVRLKPESYKMLDILWSSTSVPNLVINEALKSNVSLLGCNRKNSEMSAEYIDVMDIILNCLSGHHLYMFIVLLFINVANIDHFDMDSDDFRFPTVINILDDFRMEKSSPRFSRVNSDNKWNGCILYALKILNHLIDVFPHPARFIANKLMQLLDSIYNKVNDEILKAAIMYTFNLLKIHYSSNYRHSMTLEVDRSNIDNVTTLQKRMMQRILDRQTAFTHTVEDSDLTLNDVDDNMERCILCKQNMDIRSKMSYMCYISTNNVLRRCVSSKNLAHDRLTSNVVARSTLPLKSSIISSCGHATHTKCIVEHRKTQATANVLDVYGSHRAMNDFFCPMCKSLCNYILEYIPNNLDFELDNLLSYKGNFKLYSLSKSSWRYPYTTKWIPSPIYAKFEHYPHIVYTLSTVCCNKDLNLELYEQPKGFIEDLSLNCNIKSVKLECNDCNTADLTNLDSNCTCISLNKERTLFDVQDVRDERLLSNVYKHLTDNWGAYKTSGLANFIRIKSSNDPIVPFPKILSSAYCRIIFSSARTFFGVQNWRNANFGVKVDRIFWLIYNEMLSVCSLRRNTLTLDNPLFAQLIKTAYYNGIEQSDQHDGYHLDNIGYKSLDETYFDVLPINMEFPSTHCGETPYTKTTLLKLFLEKLNQTHLNMLAETLQLDVPTDEISSDSHITPEVCERDKDSDNIHICSTLAPCPWSVDFIREFILYFLSNNTATIENIRQRLYYFVIVGSLQILDRYVLSFIKDGYKNFINKNSADKRCKMTLLKSEFLSKLFSNYFTEFFDSAEFPVDPIQRIDWTDFDINLNNFRIFNGCSHVEPNDVYEQPCDERCKNTSNKLSEVISFASAMKDVHDKTVESFTEQIPTNTDVDTYLVKQILKLRDVREMHRFLNNGFEEEEILSAIDSVKLGSKISKRIKIDDLDVKGMENMEQIFIEVNSLNNVAVEGNSYKSIDFIKRINNLLYRNHTNIAFFETIRYHIPKAYHILDFLTPGFMGNLQQLKGFTDDMSYYRYIEYLFNCVTNNLRGQGYIHTDAVLDFSPLKGLIQEKLCLFLDISFWVISSIFTVDRDIKTKISYSHLHDSETRFNMLFEALELHNSTAERTWEIWSILFSDIYKKQLELNRICNIEIDAPIISNYEYIDFSKHLCDRNWDIVRNASFRRCCNCGLSPSSPLICLLCGTILCSNSNCCHHIKTGEVVNFLANLSRNKIDYRLTDIQHIYSDEMIAHAHACGGGQTIYISPYYCCILYIDGKKKCVVQSVYTDDYGNSDLHSKVYGEVKLSRTRLENMTNTFCSGRLANDLALLRKRLFDNFN